MNPPLVVNSTGDGADSSAADGVCNDGSGDCTLRAAIEQANATTAGFDTIAFNIPGPGPHTISPSSPLPAVTDPVLIDGYTEPGASRNTQTAGGDAVLLIVLDGASAGTGPPTAL